MGERPIVRNIWLNDVYSKHVYHPAHLRRTNSELAGKGGGNDMNHRTISSIIRAFRTCSLPPLRLNVTKRWRCYGGAV